jgi:hypothetical protein
MVSERGRSSDQGSEQVRYLLLVGAMIGSFGFDYWHDGNNAPFTRPVPVLSRILDEPDFFMTRTSQVPDLPELTPVVCFELPGKRLLQCLYKKASGFTTIEPVLPKGEDKT